MRYPTHIIFALVTILPLYHYTKLPLISYLFIASWASLLPDIDHSQSHLGKSVLSGIIRITTTHRGWTHSLFGMLVFCFIFTLILHFLKLDLAYAIPFALGYLSHLISDSLNPTGIRWFWPSKKRIGIGLITTGSKREILFRYLLIMILGIEVLKESLGYF
uniref:Metal-dependent hydrolase n=1 Tax=Geoglobus ahangari TaxID=113653 RepID=A0A7C4S610_9EURY